MNWKTTTLPTWRKAAAVGGSIALLAVAGMSATQAFADPGPATTRTTTTTRHVDQPAIKQTKQHGPKHRTKHENKDLALPSAPVDAMEALEDALAAVVPGGTVSHGTGLNVYGEGDPYAKGALRFAAPGAAGAGWISLTTFPAPEDTSVLTDCDLVEAHYPNCEVTTLPDGSVLLTHDLPVWNGPSESKRLGTNVAGLLVSHGMVVSLDVRIPFEDERDTQPLSPDAPLTTEQLVAVLSQPGWSHLTDLG